MILIDNTVLSNFSLIHHPELIDHAFVEGKATTGQVFQELERGVRLGRLPQCDWSWLKRLGLTEAENIQFHQLSEHLGAGEASCLAVTVHRQYKFATDDKDARQWAMRFNVPHTGTLGILAVLVRNGNISLSKGNAHLKKMVETGYHSPLLELDDFV